MKKEKRKLILAILLSCWLLAGGIASHASWAGMTIEEIWNKSDVVVGEIIRERGPVQGEIYGRTGWEVKVRYCIKGETKQETITVVTPDEYTSLHYNLDEWGRTVLLFISPQEDNWEPPSPQGVVPVEFNEEFLSKAPVFTGSDLMKGMKITDPKVPQGDRDKIKDLIEHSLVQGPVMVNEEVSTGFDRVMSYVVVFLGAVLLVGAFAWSKKLRKKE